ncbi:phosphoribosyltransferase-like protein [Xanthomonas campestris]|uniref:phosphoribosyltransferase-like protein n=1 Tax=Xanthomonas campestris TaxID=339 RepID=UPI00096E1183|nr:hypothetical protein [Xanthomonas campestris]MCF8825059.1 hypothetical protein [Xanthomonas campestris pv. raphani]MEA9840546.1 hypothetical protein [Xanthomonas campestris pv. raphani]MEA9874730.1 hypothetical protein [Xanthomonas campestris pv. raphani]MEA9893436.1 hypothetical protein [Xanthomonas campestris pv. raphani]MEA9934260.1 hypothetical protein [Xanthomonas campestris pv. raphani]
MEAPSDLHDSEARLWEDLLTRILFLSKSAWEGGAKWPSINQWLGNFSGLTGASPSVEKLHALYLLSQFMYYGNREIRVLLRALYSELFLLPLVRDARKKFPKLVDFKAELASELSATRFLGVGNPSESGMHLLYYFRQENQLSKNDFMDTAQIYRVDRSSGTSLRVPRHPDIKRYVFIDDICGSGETAVRYSNDLLPDLLSAAHDVEVHYLCLFATADGLDRVRRDSVFGRNSGAVHEFDGTYKWCAGESRYLYSIDAALDRRLLVQLPGLYGRRLLPHHPLGYEDGQLLLGFSHNTPDNTLPIIWSDAENAGVDWYPIFRRYPKV